MPTEEEQAYLEAVLEDMPLEPEQFLPALAELALSDPEFAEASIERIGELTGITDRDAVLDWIRLNC